MTQDSTALTVRFQYDDRYCARVVEDGEPDSWIQVLVQVGETDIYGGSSSPVTGFACGVVLHLLDSVEAVKIDQRYVIEFEYGPAWLTVDVIDDCSVEIAACHTYEGANDPNERIGVDRVATAPKEAWCRAILELAHEFETTVINLDPGMKDHPAIEQLRQRRSAVERSAT